jgi:WhiB family redox-sensing transcriptional regulator
VVKELELQWERATFEDDEPDPQEQDDLPQVRLERWYPEWHKRAACLGKILDADLNFYGQDEMGARPSLSAGQIKEARKFCASCPVVSECLEQALTSRERYGVWAGTTGRFRRQLFVLIDEGFMDLEAAMTECLRRLFGTESDGEEQDDLL